MKKGWIIAAALLATACGSSDTPDDNTTPNNETTNNGKSDDNTQVETLCVGLRGNGTKIWSHFGAMARIHEEYGTITGVAGGSSGSISSFITESIYANSELYNCAEDTCSEDEAGLRAALMFKSIFGYVEVLSQTEEAQALFQIQAIAGLVQSEQATIDQLIVDEEYEEARTAVIALLENEEIRELINPELIGLLQNSPDPQFHVQDIWGAVSQFGSFAVDSDLILIRPGLISFEGFAKKIGRIGTFYAGYGTNDEAQTATHRAQWSNYLNLCAEPTRGMNWEQIKATPAGETGATCAEVFYGLVAEWRTPYLADEDAQPTRLDDPVGAAMPTLVSTSVITGTSVANFAEARQAYLEGAPVSLDVNFDDVMFGYWGQSGDLSTIEKNDLEYSDLKTAKFMGLGNGPWFEALSLSPAEPGLTRALEINDSLVSAGGWSDLAPTLVLKNLGCDQVILVTRQGEVQGGFGPSVAALLGMGTEDDNALYDLDGDSAVHASLEAADAVMCANWDAFTDAQYAEVFMDGYNAPLQVSSDYLKEGTYENATDSVNLPACTPGVAAQ